MKIRSKTLNLICSTYSEQNDIFMTRLFSGCAILLQNEIFLNKLLTSFPFNLLSLIYLLPSVHGGQICGDLFGLVCHIVGIN